MRCSEPGHRVAAAIENAKRRATRLAEGFGAKLGKVVAIEAQGEGESVRYRLLNAPTFGEGTYSPGKIRFESEVDAIFELTDEPTMNNCRLTVSERMERLPRSVPTATFRRALGAAVVEGWIASNFLNHEPHEPHERVPGSPAEVERPA